MRRALWSYSYDSAGRVLSVTAPDPDGAGPLSAPVTSFAYDVYGRVEEVTHPDNETVTFAYDAADNRIAVTDELGNPAAYVFDALNRLLSATDRELATTTFAYNAIGLLTTQTDALGNATVHEYNSRGWLTKTIKPDPDGTGPLTGGGSEYTYDAAGNLIGIGKMLWLGGAAISHSYDAGGRRTLTTGPSQFVSTSFDYDNLGRLIRTTDTSGLKTEYAYDAANNVVRTQLKDSTWTQWAINSPITLYSYDAAGQLISQTDPRGYTTDYVYNNRGLLETTLLPDPDGSGPQGRPYSTSTFDNLGRLIAVTDHLSRSTLYELDSRDRLTKITAPDPDGSGPLSAPVTSFVYDAGGRLISQTDPLLHVSGFAYDKEGRLVTRTAPDPDGVGPLTSPATHYTYDVLGNLLTVTDPLGGVTENVYDHWGRVVETILPDPDGLGGQTSPTMHYVYNSQGTLASTIDPAGRETSFTYDNYGRKTAVTDDAGNITTYAYNNLDQVTSVTQPDPDGAGSLAASVTGYAYDSYHRLKETTDAATGKVRYAYDNANNLLTLADPLNNITSYAYDGLGRVTMETSATSDARSFYYDSAGRLARRVDRNSQIRQFSYDDLDRNTAEKWYSDGVPVPIISIVTTTEGGLTNEVQRVGFSDSWGIISGGTFTLSFAGYTTATIAYNASGATVQTALEGLASVGSGNVSVVKSTDLMGRKEWTVTFIGDLGGTNVAQTTINASGISGVMITGIQATDAEGGIANDEQQLITLSNADGGTMRLAFKGQTTAALAHDATAAQIETALEELPAIDQVSVTGAAGGPWTVTFGGAHSGINQSRLNADAAALTSGTLQRQINFVYDVAGQLTEASDLDSSYTFDYDGLGRMLSVDNFGTPGVANIVLSSAYDSASNRTSLSAEISGVDDFFNSYTFDGLSRLTRLDQNGQSGGNAVDDKRIDFDYNALGQFTSIARYNNVAGGAAHEVAAAIYSYDSLQRLIGLAYQQDTVDLFTPYSWSYDNMSRLTQIVSADGTSDFAYDMTSQLTVADHDYQTDESYSYDVNGNRTMSGYSTGADNRLLSDGVYNYAYDNEGNRISKTEIATGAATHYTWDHRNRLVEVAHLDANSDPVRTLQYKYDLFNRRIERSDTPAVGPTYIERYIYDGEHLALRFTAGQLSNRYLHGPVIDQILADEKVDSLSSAGDVLWPLTDHLGTVRDLAEFDELAGITSIVNHISYNAFGGITDQTNSAVDHLFGYTGRDWDAGAEIQYNRARWYDPAVGRWLSQDPISFAAGDANLYRYVGNQPTNAVDPSGLLVQVFIGGGIGFAIGGVTGYISNGWEGAAIGAVAGGVGGAVTAATLNPAIGVAAWTGVGTWGAGLLGASAAGAAGGAAGGVTEQVGNMVLGREFDRDAVWQRTYIGGAAGLLLGYIPASGATQLNNIQVGLLSGDIEIWTAVLDLWTPLWQDYVLQ
jgi:RHS repeat-associated protein